MNFVLFTLRLPLMTLAVPSRSRSRVLVSTLSVHCDVLFSLKTFTPSTFALRKNASRKRDFMKRRRQHKAKLDVWQSTSAKQVNERDLLDQHLSDVEMLWHVSTCLN